MSVIPHPPPDTAGAMFIATKIYKTIIEQSRKERPQLYEQRTPHPLPRRRLDKLNGNWMNHETMWEYV